MTQQKISYLALLVGVLSLTACDIIYPPTERPDYAIQVTPSSQGGTATAPTCPSWATSNANPYDNQPSPQYGCATARNLALEVETPNDLVDARKLGDMRGVAAVGAVRRYDANQQRGLIVPGAEDNSLAASSSSSASSSLGGDITGGASAPSSSSSAASSP